MNAERWLYGLDVGGTKLAAVVADTSGQIRHKVRRPTPAQAGPDGILDVLVEMVQEVAGAVGARGAPARLGVSFGGLVAGESGIVRRVPNLPGWDNYPLRERLEERFPGWRVRVENDANATALAEWRFGAARGYRYVLYLTMGTGIGGGIVVDGRLYRGAIDLAGEIGHHTLLPDGPTCSCGKRGCLEALCSGPAIARRAREKIQAGMDPGDLLERAGVSLEELRTEHLLEAARAGNPFAQEHFQETAYFMGWGIANAVSILNPDIVVLGTVATAAGELFFRPLRQYVRRFAIAESGRHVRVVPAGLDEYTGDYAALALIIDESTPTS